MDRKTLGILEELSRYVPSRNRHHIVENRARNVIASAMNLMTLIRESYSEEEADELTKRLINSIRGEDEAKFIRGIRKLREEEERGQK